MKWLMFAAGSGVVDTMAAVGAGVAGGGLVPPGAIATGTAPFTVGRGGPIDGGIATGIERLYPSPGSSYRGGREPRE